MYRASQLFIILFIALITARVNAQTGNAPYSRFGIGEVNFGGNVYSGGMGGLGVSNSSQAYINFINPALAARNKIAAFEAGINAEYKQLATETVQRNTSNGNISYLAFSFPISKKITLGTGLLPYSRVNYTVTSLERVPGTPAFTEYSFKGAGGINRAYLTLGANVFKGLYAGVQANYNFGFFRTEALTVVIDSQQPGGYGTELLNRANLSDVSLKWGFAYRLNIGNETFVNVGAVYEAENELRLKQFKAAQRRTTRDEVFSADTIAFDEPGTIRLPAQLSYGVSIEKPFKYMFGVDFSTQSWSDYVGLDGLGGLSDTYRLSVGGEIVPDITSVDNYFKRVTYRAGVYFTQLPVTIEGRQPEEIGINFGLSLPVSRNLSSLNLAFTAGQRGTTQDNLIRERFFRINLGITVNDPQWFFKRKFN